MRLWDIDGAFSTITSEYCTKVCGGKRCPNCPAPTLLDEAHTGVVAYSACSTQWRVGYTGRTSLDYPACIAVLDLKLPQWTQVWPQSFDEVTRADLFDDLQVIEGSMLGADSERCEREAAEAAAAQAAQPQ